VEFSQSCLPLQTVFASDSVTVEKYGRLQQCYDCVKSDRACCASVSSILAVVDMLRAGVAAESYMCTLTSFEQRNIILFSAILDCWCSPKLTAYSFSLIH
jgi:hypothetical protein